MQRLVHHLEPTRQCSAAMNSWSGGKPDGISTVIGVQGFNYLHNGGLDSFHKSNPHKPAIGTEEASAFLTPGQSAVFRTHFTATPQELAAPAVLLTFGMIDDDGWVYVNGQLAGQSHDWTAQPSFWKPGPTAL